MLTTPTFTIKTLGCKVNQYESQLMRESLTRCGFIETGSGQPADYCLINSCTVTHKADRDTRNLINRFHRISPNGKIAVIGCYAELDSDRNALMNIPGVTYLVKNNEKERISDILVRDFSPKTPDPRRATTSSVGSVIAVSGGTLFGADPQLQITDFKDRNRVFIKVQDGCDFQCSYCKVSRVRGPSRSRGVEDILSEIKRLLEREFKEIVLTGICLGSWGKEFAHKADSQQAGEMSLTDLVRKISCVKGLFRIRLSSIEPTHVTDDVIRVFKDDDKICKHFHIPLQSGDDRILRSMNRPYTAKYFRQIIQKIRRHIPDAAVTTDVLVGFPAEDKKSFLHTLRFIEDISPSRMHVFSYSIREGTGAARLSYDLDRSELKARVKALKELEKSLSITFAKSFIGRTQHTIIENYRDKTTGFLEGYTDRYIRVFIDGSDSFKNTLIPVKIKSVSETRGMVFGSPEPGNVHSDAK